MVARGDGQGAVRVPRRGHELRGPPLHPLHLGLDRKAKGGRSHDSQSTPSIYSDRLGPDELALTSRYDLQGGYLLGAAVSVKYVFDVHPGDKVSSLSISDPTHSLGTPADSISPVSFSSLAWPTSDGLVCVTSSLDATRVLTGPLALVCLQITGHTYIVYGPLLK